MTSRPLRSTDVLLERGISQLGATRALEDACNYDGRTYGAALNTDDAGAVLQLISRAGYDSYAVQEIVTGIATTHPQLLLEHLRGQANNGVRIRDDIHELDTAYDAHPDALATWIRNNLNNPHADLVLGAAVNDHLTMNQGAALAQLAADLDGDQLRSFVDVLAHIETWALDQPDLVHAITNRAREAGTHDQTRRRIKDAMGPRHWGTVNGVSEELSAALTRANNAAEHATDEDLKADYQEALAYIQARIDDERREQDEEDDNGW